MGMKSLAQFGSPLCIRSIGMGMLRVLLLLTVMAQVALGHDAVGSLPLLGSPGGPPITAPRIQLKDGRHLAYKEFGVPRACAKYKIIYTHAYKTCRLDAFIVATLPPGFLEKYRIYVVSFDRAGYGQSDPDPNRSIMSEASDLEQLADQLGLGPKFFLVGYSMGAQALWGVLKQIPHRIAGAALISPVVNLWWKGLPTDFTSALLNRMDENKRKFFQMLQYYPSMVYSVDPEEFKKSDALTPEDEALMRRYNETENAHEAIQQGVYVSLAQDMVVGFGRWDFSPMDLQGLFKEEEGSFHLWQGTQDQLAPAHLQKHIAQNLTWIKYHEVPGAGHFFLFEGGMAETILKELLFADQKKAS